ncbi:hypothetical protein [Micromonospora sp. NPDC047738]|uniref:hypothetical protein n=1 Tax=unclassified Micromonospora TaxID=2617518 RepID=UPI003402941C
MATLVVVGASTMLGLAWLTLLMMPALVVVQILATRVSVLSGRDLQRAVRDGYGRLASSLLRLGTVQHPCTSGVEPWARCRPLEFERAAVIPRPTR